jgi:hypothetical protein
MGTHYRVLPALHEDVPTSQWRGSYEKTYLINVNTSRTLEEGAHSPSWPNGIIIISITLKPRPPNNYKGVFNTLLHDFVHIFLCLQCI